MNNEYFAEMHKLIEKAKSFERMGREEEALKIYLEIHENFFPNTSDLFERPAILLEKRKRFDEAIQICEKAIKLIGEGKITGVKDNFERRIFRIKSRSDYDGKLKNNSGKAEKIKKEAPDKGKVKFSLFSLFKKPDIDTPKDDHPSEKAHKERIPIQERKPEASQAKSTMKVVPKTEKTMPKTEASEEEIPIKMVPKSEPVEVVKVEIPKAPELEVHEEAPSKPEPQKVELQALPVEPSQPKKRLKLKLPKIHFSKPQLEDFKTMIRDIKNFKFSDMKFFIFDLSEIKHGKFKLRKPSKSEWLALGIIVTTIILLMVAIANKPKSQFEIAFDTSGFEWSQDITTDISEENKKDLPPITASMIDAAVKKTQTMPGVRMAGVIVQKNVVGFIVMTTPEADRKQAKEASETFIKALASAAAAENKDLSGPGPIGYGELFDYYALIVVAGENYDNLLLKGSKNPKAPGVFWRNEEK